MIQNIDIALVKLDVFFLGDEYVSKLHIISSNKTDFPESSLH